MPKLVDVSSGTVEIDSMYSLRVPSVTASASSSRARAFQWIDLPQAQWQFRAVLQIPDEPDIVEKALRG